MHAYERLNILFGALQWGSNFGRTFTDTNIDAINTKVLNPFDAHDWQKFIVESNFFGITLNK